MTCLARSEKNELVLCDPSHLLSSWILYLFSNKCHSAQEASCQFSSIEVQIELPASVQLAAQQCLYAYDAYLLYCALRYHAPLLTLDRALAHCATEMDIKVLEVMG